MLHQISLTGEAILRVHFGKPSKILTVKSCQSNLVGFCVLYPYCKIGYRFVRKLSKLKILQICNGFMKINSCLIQKSIEYGELKELSTFLYFKHIFTNSCIYDYSQQSLSIKTGLSRTFIKKHISFFLDNGWAFFHGKNLMLAKVSKIDDNKKKLIIDINTDRGYKYILEQLQCAYLKHKANQAKWYSNLCHDLNKMTSSQRNKKIKTLSKKLDRFRYNEKKQFFGESGNSKFRLSFKKIAEWFNCSVGKAHSIIKGLCQTGFIDYSVFYESIKVKVKYEINERLEADKKAFYTKSGYVCRVLCSEYVFR